MALYNTRASRYWLTGYAEEEYALDGPIAKFNTSTTSFVVPVVFAESDLTGVFNSTASGVRVSGIDTSLTTLITSQWSSNVVSGISTDLNTQFNSNQSASRIQLTGADLNLEFASTIAATGIRNVFSSIGLQFDIEASAQALIIKLAEAELTSISALTVIPTRVVISSADLDGVFSESVLALRQPRSDYRTIQVIEEDRTIFIDQETRTLIVLGEDRTLHVYGVYS